VTKKVSGLSTLLLLGTIVACSTNSLLKKDIPRGELLYRQKCRNCHNLVQPNKFSDEEWAFELTDMAHKSGLTKEESELIWGYLASHN